jgi:hypothetical protein
VVDSAEMPSENQRLRAESMVSEMQLLGDHFEYDGCFFCRDLLCHFAYEDGKSQGGGKEARVQDAK